MKAILEFLFGKQNLIFDKKGNVQHNHPKAKWEDWNERYSTGPEYNWKNHTGMKASNSKRN